MKDYIKMAAPTTVLYFVLSEHFDVSCHFDFKFHKKTESQKESTEVEHKV
jgi:hypothetical protein